MVTVADHRAKAPTWIFALLLGAVAAVTRSNAQPLPSQTPPAPGAAGAGYTALHAAILRQDTKAVAAP